MNRGKSAADDFANPPRPSQGPGAAHVDPAIALQNAGGGGNQAVLDQLNAGGERRRVPRAVLDASVGNASEVLETYGALWDRGLEQAVQCAPVANTGHPLAPGLLRARKRALAFASSELHPEVSGYLGSIVAHLRSNDVWSSPVVDDGQADVSMLTGGLRVRAGATAYVERESVVGRGTGRYAVGGASTSSQSQGTKESRTASGGASGGGLTLGIGGSSERSRSAVAGRSGTGSVTVDHETVTTVGDLVLECTVTFDTDSGRLDAQSEEVRAGRVVFETSAFL